MQPAQNQPAVDNQDSNGETQNQQQAEPASVEKLKQLQDVPYDVSFGKGDGVVEKNGVTFNLTGRPYMGSEDASIDIVGFEDFFCPYCNGFHSQEFAQANGMNSAFPQIVDNYIETGEARYFLRLYPVVGGTQPAEYAECVGEHGTSEDFYTFMYNHFSKWNDLQQYAQNDRQTYTEILDSWVAELPVDDGDVQTCIREGEGSRIIQQTATEANMTGKEVATPSNFVNGEIVKGAQPYRAFETILEAQ